MPGPIITIAQQKGGAGKTTVTAHLAVAYARQGLAVALLDVDPQGSLGEWFEARERSLGETGTGLRFGTASGWGARREARSLARDHDVVLIDTPPKSDLEAGPAIESADLVAMPIQPTRLDVWATRATLDMVAKERVRSILVLNRMPPRLAVSSDVLEAVRQMHAVAQARLGNRIAFADCMGHGASVQETAPSSKGAAEVAALAAELLQIARR